MRLPVMSLLSLLAVGSCPPAGAQHSGAEGDRSWVDTSYEYVTTRADTLAQQFDSFFGEADAERESADSVLRLQSEYDWNEQEQSDTGIRLRGKVDLPQLNRRLSLVFGEENDYRSDVLPSTGSRMETLVCSTSCSTMHAVDSISHSVPMRPLISAPACGFATSSLSMIG